MAQSWQQSPDIQLEWAGWRTSSRALQAHGWEFIINKNIREFGDVFEFILRHRHCRMSTRLRVPFEWAMRRATSWQEALEDVSRWRPVQVERIVAEDHHLLLRREIAPAAWSRVDMEPIVVDMATVPLSHTNLFRPWAPEAQEIIAEPATVMSLLEQIKSLQAPELAEIRKRRRINGEPTGEQVSAQIITLAA